MGAGENTNTSITIMKIFFTDVRQQLFLDVVPINILQSRFTGQFDSVADDRLLFKLPPSCCMLLAISSPQFVQAVCSHFIPGYSDVVSGIRNVVVFTQLPGGMFIFSLNVRRRH